MFTIKFFSIYYIRVFMPRLNSYSQSKSYAQKVSELRLELS